MKKKIILYMKFNIPFSNIAGSEQVLTKEWIEYRINIFMNFTCSSLINQTNQSFLAIIMYHSKTHKFIYDALSKYPKLPPNIIFVSSSDNTISKYIHDYINGCDYVYSVRLDCDDMYHPTFIQQLIDLQHDDTLECIINQKGYVYDCINNRIGHWYHQSPPFYTLVYKPSEYPHKYNGGTWPNGHHDAINLNHIILDKPNYMIVIHSKNSSTIFDLKNCKEILNNDLLKANILSDFKVEKLYLS